MSHTQTPALGLPGPDCEVLNRHCPQMTRPCRSVVGGRDIILSQLLLAVAPFHSCGIGQVAAVVHSEWLVSRCGGRILAGRDAG